MAVAVTPATDGLMVSGSAVRHAGRGCHLPRRATDAGLPTGQTGVGGVRRNGAARVSSPAAAPHSSRALRSKKHGPRRLPLRFALRVRLAAFADASRCPWKAAVAAKSNGRRQTMNILHTIDTDYELTWDEFLITVEDLHLIETGADLADDDYATVLAAFERGLSPNGCVMSIIDARRPLDARAHWFHAA
jgi:hypothetical protein